MSGTQSYKYRARNPASDDTEAILYFSTREYMYIAV